MAKKPAMGKRRGARYAAIQALYQAEVTGRPMTEVMAEFEAHRLDDLFVFDETGEQGAGADKELFRKLAAGAAGRIGELDPAIEGALAEGWSMDRCGYTLRSILRLGAFELAHARETDIATVITEYVELARGFFEGKEPAFIHAVLDRMAPDLRKASASLADLVELSPPVDPDQP